MIIGFHFTKINVEQTAPLKGKVSITNGIDISEVSDHPYNLKKGQKAINFHFVYSVNYRTDIGSITLEGDVLQLVDEQRYKQVIDLWKTKKKIPSAESVIILNTVLNKCNIKALELSQELNLPPHIPLPKVNFASKNIADNYIG